jgi:hypothetical protein
LDEHWDEIQIYENQWLAASAEGVEAYHESLDKVFKQIEAKDKRLSDVTFLFVTSGIIQ